MGGKDNDAILTQLYQQVAEADPFARVESRSRFIHHKDTRQMQQYQCNPYPLLHSSRERADLIILTLVHMYRLQDILDSFITDFLISQPFQDGLIIEELRGSHIFIRTELLWEEADQTLQLFPVYTGIQAVDPDGSVALLQNPSDNTHQR
ncbi:hypothetical protein SDC9_175489 [bioreactor metagenome]|uniref:Uncharacterized protein n=1 Tax=bioreactor metagenome TaxID=1076179 RepID=A0A645GPB2_9ZZZZ